MWFLRVVTVIRMKSSSGKNSRHILPSKHFNLYGKFSNLITQYSSQIQGLLGCACM
jgi:hypothetical protein